MSSPQADAGAPAAPVAEKQPWMLRALVVGAAIGGWFLTQSLISKRTPPSGGIDDGMHQLTAPLHDYLVAHTTAANVLMIISSEFIDALAIFVLIRAIFGPTIRPFVGLFMLFCLRQFCQMLVSLPEPHEMIWRYPGCPALLVTYGVATDLFFSGHTSVAVYGAIELSRMGKKWLVLGVAIAIFEMLTVLTLRAHYTMDVFAALMTAFWVSGVSELIAPWCDRKLGALTGRSSV